MLDERTYTLGSETNASGAPAFHAAPPLQKTEALNGPNLFNLREKQNTEEEEEEAAREEEARRRGAFKGAPHLHLSSCRPSLTPAGPLLLTPALVFFPSFLPFFMPCSISFLVMSLSFLYSFLLGALLPISIFLFFPLSIIQSRPANPYLFSYLSPFLSSVTHPFTALFFFLSARLPKFNTCRPYPLSLLPPFLPPLICQPFPFSLSFLPSFFLKSMQVILLAFPHSCHPSVCQPCIYIFNPSLPSPIPFLFYLLFLFGPCQSLIFLPSFHFYFYFF